MSTVMPAVQPPMGSADQRRAARRHRVLKSARIIINDNLTYDCTLRDLSDTGAKVLVGSALALPSTFRLFILGEGVVRQVRLAWRQPNACGVIFVGEPTPYQQR